MTSGSKTTRPDVTAGLTELAEAWFAKERMQTAREVLIETREGERRVDIMAYRYPLGRVGLTAAAEQGKVTFCEVKSCVADYRSGHGLSFYGDENLLVCPLKVAMELEDEIPRHVGIRVPVPIGRSLGAEVREPTEYRGEAEGWHLKLYRRGVERQYPGRSFPLAYLMAQMIYAKYAHERGSSR